MALCPRGLHRCTYWCHRNPDWPYEVLRRWQDAVRCQALLILPFPTRLPYIHSNFLGIDEELIFGCKCQEWAQRDDIRKAPSCLLKIHSAWWPGLFSVGHSYRRIFLPFKAFFFQCNPHLESIFLCDVLHAWSDRHALHCRNAPLRSDKQHVIVRLS